MRLTAKDMWGALGGIVISGVCLCANVSRFDAADRWQLALGRREVAGSGHGGLWRSSKTQVGRRGLLRDQYLHHWHAAMLANPFWQPW